MVAEKWNTRDDWIGTRDPNFLPFFDPTRASLWIWKRDLIRQHLSRHRYTVWTSNAWQEVGCTWFDQFLLITFLYLVLVPFQESTAWVQLPANNEQRGAQVLCFHTFKTLIKANGLKMKAHTSKRIFQIFHEFSITCFHKRLPMMQ